MAYGRMLRGNVILSMVVLFFGVSLSMMVWCDQCDVDTARVSKIWQIYG